MSSEYLNVLVFFQLIESTFYCPAGLPFVNNNIHTQFCTSLALYGAKFEPTDIYCYLNAKLVARITKKNIYNYSEYQERKKNNYIEIHRLNINKSSKFYFRL